MSENDIGRHVKIFRYHEAANALIAELRDTGVVGVIRQISTERGYDIRFPHYNVWLPTKAVEFVDEPVTQPDPRVKDRISTPPGLSVFEPFASYEQELAELRAENAKLRAALEEIKGMTTPVDHSVTTSKYPKLWTIYDIAKKALEGK